MSETKTRKSEALALLALETMTDEQEAELNLLTMNQAFPGLKERWQATGTTTPILTPRYCDSVDECLTLPIGLPVAGAWWNLHSDAHNLRYTRDKKCGARIMSLTDEIRGATLPLAMLKAWWSIQPDS